MDISDACNPQSTACESSEGDIVTITCSLDPEGGMGALSVITPSAVEIPGPTHVLNGIQLDEAGRYFCQAENDDGICTPAQVPIDISVAGKFILQSRMVFRK